MNGRAFRFLAGLVAALAAAWLFPEPGAAGGFLRTEWTTRIAIFLIFLNLGLLLVSEEMRGHLLEWKLHLFIQGCTFLLFPLLVLTADYFFGTALHPDLRVGFFYLAILPTTISTSVVFTANAGGNVTGAVLNSTLSNLLAVLLVPAWMSWVIQSLRGVEVALLPLFLRIVLLIAVPLFIGQLLRPHLKSWVDRRRKLLLMFNNGCIFFIVYAAFANSVSAGIWEKAGGIMPVCFFASLGLLLLVSSLVWWGSGRMRFGWPSRLAGLYCGSQKALATGVAMATPVFAGVLPPEKIGIVLLPIMCYHPLQLILGGLLLGRFHARPESTAGS